MKLLSIFLAAVPLTYAHMHITNLFVDGVDQGDMTCIRGPADPSKFTYPVEWDLNSPDMACGAGGTTGVKRVCPIPDGATLTFQYRKDPNNPTQAGGYLDVSHIGSCSVYLKRVDNAMYDGAAGDGWFKIWDMGYTDQWCTVKMSQGGGLLTVNLPKGLQGGYYLVRPELLALHNAKDHDPQYYVSCAQVYIQSSGDLIPDGTHTASIPGYCSIDDKANSWNAYIGQDPKTYIPPGPAPVQLVSGGSSNNNAPMPDGGKPEGCVLDYGGWCGIEVKQYKDQDGCWASQKDCYSQGEVCWKTVQGGMLEGCKIWNSKCQDITNRCQGGDWNGPPDMGKDLTPPRKTINVPQPLGPTRAPDAPSNRYGAMPMPGQNKAAPAPAPAQNSAPKPWWCNGGTSNWGACQKLKGRRASDML